MQEHHARPLRTASAMLLALSALAACSSAPVSTPEKNAASTAPAKTATAAPQNDYSKPENWLCKPGRNDACATDLTATVIKPNGETTREAWTGNPNAQVDCFYVYPTVSNDPTINSDMVPGAEEQRAAQAQLARFGSACRLFAPMYRQVTLSGLRSRLMGKSIATESATAYGDVVNAWNHYLKHENNGRGVIFIGHSQGARMLTDLIKNEIEGKPVQQKMVSALLIGFNTPVTKGKDTGGTFRQIPLCRSAGQTGCVISYVSFRESSPPPANSLFGRSSEPGTVAACTNPAALGGGRGTLRPYFSTKTDLMNKPLTGTKWSTFTQKLDTPFASTPGMVSAECIERDNASYLAVKVDPAYTAKGADIPGDLMFMGTLRPEWGLHLVDVDLAMGNLLDIVQQQTQTYLKAGR